MSAVDETFSIDSLSLEHLSSSTPALDSSPPLGLDEELVNAATHGLGLVLSLGAMAGILLVPGSSVATLAATLVFLAALALVYALSTVSHAVPEGPWKETLRVWDQGTIYLLIAGTYSPILVALTSSVVAVSSLMFIWILAAAGFYSKVGMRHRIHAFSATSYVLLGWVPGMILAPLVPLSCFAWIAAGGLSYTAGTYFLMRDRQVKYYHGIWHAFVLAGSGLHAYAIFRYALWT